MVCVFVCVCARAFSRSVTSSRVGDKLSLLNVCTERKRKRERNTIIKLLWDIAKIAFDRRYNPNTRIYDEYNSILFDVLAKGAHVRNSRSCSKRACV